VKRSDKRYKITPEDWRNREKWPLYEGAANEMIDRTSARHALDAGRGERQEVRAAKVLRTIVQRLEEDL